MGLGKLSVPFDHFRCAQCRGVKESSLCDHALYSRGFFLFRQKDSGLDELRVDVDIVRLRRTLGSSGTYSVQAEYLTRCPQCHESTVRLEQLATLHLSAFVSLAACPRCGGKGQLLANNIQMEQTDEATDSITADGTFRCTNCMRERSAPIRVIFRVSEFVRSLLQRPTAMPTQQSDCEPWNGQGPVMVTVRDVANLTVGEAHMGDKINIQGTVTGSAVGTLPTVKARDIWANVETVDSVANLDASVQQAFSDARNAIEDLELGKDDKNQLIDSLDRLAEELVEDKPGRSRIQKLWSHITATAPTVASILKSVESLAKLVSS